MKNRFKTRSAGGTGAKFRQQARIFGGASVIWLLLMTVPGGEAHAYIGPGAGFAVVTSFGFLILSFLFTLVGVLLFPLIYLKRRIKRWGLSKIPRDLLRRQKAVVVGLDGLSPDIVEKMFALGKLPHLAKLKEQGDYRHLRTTVPAESPVAWSSFLTGCNPGKHAVFDFLSRNPASYLPAYSIAKTHPAAWKLRLGSWVIPLKPGKTVGLRRQRPFWMYLAERGLRTIIQRVPVTYPPEPFEGQLLAAMGIPDLLGTQGTFTYFTTRPGAEGVEEGGRIIPLAKNGKGFFANIPGPEDQFSASVRQSLVKLSLTTTSESQADLGLDGALYPLVVGQYSHWIELRFSLSGGGSVRGMARFLLQSIAPEMELYMSPINIDPEKPVLPISHPAFYSRYLSLATGKYNTLGLAEDTWAFNENKLSPEDFLTHCEGIFQEKRALFELELNRMKSGLLVHVFDLTDRIQHMFWQYSDPEHPAFDPKTAEKYGAVIETIYEKVDKFVGEVAGKIGPDDLLIILSDHGFNSFKYAVHLNTWLLKEGYLALEKGREESLKFFRGVNWKKTRAYALGLNGLYLNMKGRESEGIVPESEALELKRELKGKLESYLDPELGCKLIHAIHLREETFHGDYLSHAPDMIVGYHRGFRASWQTTLGGIPRAVWEINRKNWSGDHCISPELIPGVLFCNRPISSKNPSIMDLAPSILGAFKVETPAHMDGTSFLD